MKLKDELGLRKGYKNFEHEGVLNIYYTGEMLSKKAKGFFSEYGITEAQFNIMSILFYQAKSQEGLSQATISDMMLVHRSNITYLVDRLEKNKLAKREAVPGDRRYYSVHLTDKGHKLFERVEREYLLRIKKIMGTLGEVDLQRLISALEKVREYLRTMDLVTQDALSGNG